MVLAILAAFLIFTNFFFLKKFFEKNQKNRHKKSSLGCYYNYCSLFYSSVSVILLLIVIDSQMLKFSLILVALGLSSIVSYKLLNKGFNAQKHLEQIGKFVLIIATITSVLITALIVVSIVFEAIKFFKLVSISEFLFGLKWNPQSAIRTGQSVAESSFGVIPVLTGTILITTIAMVVAIPIGLMSAIYLSNYARARTRNVLKPVLEILAGVPTVVYGYFAALVIAPFIRDLGGNLGLNVSSESALAAGLVMGVMIIPFILSLSDDVLNAVPKSLSDNALALGSTRREIITKILIPTAMPGIIGAGLLAISRAIGETMIVVMAAGLVANLTFNPLNSVTTATAQIVTLLVGDQEFDSPKTLSAFAIALVLFVITLILNVIALVTVNRFKKKYE